MTRKKTHDDIESHTLILPPLRVKPSEYRQINANVLKAGFPNRSAFIRHACINPNIIVRESMMTVEVLRDLKGIANNLNQLTRKTHIQDEYDREKLHHTLSVLESVFMELMRDKL